MPEAPPAKMHHSSSPGLSKKHSCTPPKTITPKRIRTLSPIKHSPASFSANDNTTSSNPEDDDTTIVNEKTTTCTQIYNGTGLQENMIQDSYFVRNRPARTTYLKFVICHHNSHPNYDNNFLKGYDIAILFLERNATPSYRVKPIPGIAHKTLYYTKCKCFITGWGIKSMVRLPSAASKNIESKTDGYGHLAVTLQEAEIEVISNSKCNSRRYWDGLVKPTNICAFHKKTAACEGDSGGPLVCKVQNQYILVGVTSWGSSSCMSYPTVFADIAKFWEWTQDRILQYRMLVREIKTDDTKLEMEMNIFQEK
ncbi:CELA1 [Mytilus edulis]|uniref:CELA1 n=1 Tax=Mytilus edulis TaxID=6550 RepID=A0A8S3VFV7_MYTED|nr:CELA1 [Mytilus edulis]